jgi:RNA polymerase sigma-70 factor (ECF subfamily)
MTTRCVIGVGVTGRAEPSDEELMSAYQAGERGAFRTLYRRHAPILRRFMRRGLVRASDAEDLVQQTFFRLHAARQRYFSGAPFRPWFMKIAVNVKREHFRWWGRRAESELVLDGRSDPRARRGDPELALTLARAYAAVAALPRAQREAVELRAEGFTFPEAAERARQSVVCMKMRARRGSERVRRAV